MEFKISEIKDYAPQIGHLVSMMDYARETTLQAVQGMRTEELDYLANEGGNTIGALLLHMAAVDRIFQMHTFEKRDPNEKEIAELGAALSLGEKGRKEIKGCSLDFYTQKLTETRLRTLEAFQQRNDDWLYEEIKWGDRLSNNYFIWFHVFEDEINHRGQIRILRKMLKLNEY